MPAGAITLADITSADWSLALDQPGDPGSGIGNVVQGVADVNQCIQIILTTPKGSDPLRPTFGADLWKFLDAPINAAISAIVTEVTTAITQWEPRVKLTSVTAAPIIDSSAQSGARMSVNVSWRLQLTGAAAAGPSQQTVIVIPAP
jgi:phage baseplate assembly protein W